MNIWRMKLRAGDYGDDMFPLCLQRGIASMTDFPIYDVDLTHLDKKDVDPEVKTAARSSIWRFAWDMVGGDIILVGDSESKSIIARGYVEGNPGERAYRYNDKSPMVEPSNPQARWRHEVPVSWDKDFKKFPYKDGAPRITVMHYDPSWAAPIHAPAALLEARRNDKPEHDWLNEDAHLRETPSSQRNILKLHSALSNRFRRWLKKEFRIKAIQEENRIDLHFTHRGMTHLAELKICYGENTKRAIRDALGQVLEYNVYPPGKVMNSWLIVLDHDPSQTDRQFIALLREKFSLPLTLGWRDGAGFSFDKQILQG